MIRRLLSPFFVASLMVMSVQDASAAPLNIDGDWFSCEYAHSRIPPEDDCRMLDDDGFRVSNGRIEHIKVKDSRELNCRHRRKGQCFLRDREKIVVSRDPLGPIRATEVGFSVTYWGCSQDYVMTDRGNFVEIVPAGRHCLWTKDKHYYVARYRGEVKAEDR